MKYWYDYSQYYNVSQGSLDCCSDTIVGMHYIESNEMLLLDYLIYKVHPFGLEKNLTEKLPSKLPFDDVMKASEGKSYKEQIFEERRRFLRLQRKHRTTTTGDDQKKKKRLRIINKLTSEELMY